MEQFEFHPHRELTMPENQHDEFDDKFDRNENPDGNEDANERDEFDDTADENSDENPNADSLNAELHALIQEGLPYPENSPQRRKIKNAIARKIQQSGQLLRRDSPHYEDALSLTWRYFWGNLWEATTVEKPFSEPTCKILHRLNKYLKYRLLDAEQNARKEQQQRQQHRSPDGEWMDIAESIPAPEPDPIIAQLRDFIQTDPTGELQATHVRRKPEITAQLLLWRRGIEDEPWKDLEADLQTRISTLSDFYQNKCLPLIRRLFGEDG